MQSCELVFHDFQNRYLRARYEWALDDLGKRGLKESHAVSVTLYAQTMAQSVRKEKKGTRIITELRFPENEKVDKRAKSAPIASARVMW